MLTATLLALLPAAAPQPSAPAPAAQGCGCWELVQTTGTPNRRHECGSLEFDGDLVLIGGRGFRTVDTYDPDTTAWTRGATGPLEIHHFEPVELEGQVWIAGAFTGPFPNETPVPEIRLYDPLTDSWSIGPTIPGGRRRGSAAAAVRDGVLYLVGGNVMGHNGGFVPWFDSYDPQTGTWTALPDAPHARDHATAQVIGNKLVVAGGRRSQLPQVQANTIAIVDVFDFSTGSWESLPAPIPTERAGLISAAHGEHLIVVGGESATQAHRAVEALDMLTEEWVVLPDMLQPRHGLGGALLDEVLHATVGVPNLGGSPELNSLETLDLVGLLGQSPSNRLTNPEFDVDLSGWSGAGVRVAAGSIAPGSIEITGGAALQTVAASAFETVQLRGVAERTTGSSATVLIEALDGVGGVLDSTSAPIPSGLGWASFELELTAPGGTQDWRVSLNAAPLATLRVDDLALVEKPGELPYFGFPANTFALRPTGDGGVLGTTWQPSIDHSDFVPTALTDVLVLAGAPTDLLLPNGVILVDPVANLAFSAAPGANFVLPIPNDTQLAGRVLYVQGASFAALEFGLTNAIELTLTTP